MTNNTIDDILLYTNKLTKEQISFTYNKETDIFHLNYFKHKRFSINNFDFGPTEFRNILSNLARA
jgi:hypothetical protein